MIIVNIYWSDLSESGQDTLINAGFVVTESQRYDSQPVGSLHADIDENGKEVQAFKWGDVGS